ncbi:hypothetical protein OG481_09685 [Streptomyces longwoodensis]|nr:hypothetical protein [Streptomyces longwoodensis]WRY88787.1 hypothetical protein OG481_09685 [Streptomyces longwoodensis]
MGQPGAYVLAALVCWTAGGLMALTAGALALTTAIRNHRRNRT